MSNYWKKKIDELEEITSKSYWDQKVEELEAVEQKKAITTTRADKDDDLAPIKKDIAKEEEKLLKKKEEDQPWYKRGHFADGYQIGDVAKSILGIDPAKKTEKDSLIKPRASQADIAAAFHGDDPNAPKQATMSLEELAKKKEESKSQADKLKYTKLYNQEYLAQTSKVLAETEMDGTGHSILEEMELVARMDSGKEKRQRKKAVLDKMEEMGIDTNDYALFVEDKNFTAENFLKWLGNATELGLNNFNKSLTNTLDTILGVPLQKLGWENNPISKLDEYYTAMYESSKHDTELMAEKLSGSSGGGLGFASDAVEGTVAALPNALLAFLTAGKSLEGTTAGLIQNAAYQGANILQKAGMTATNMIKDSQFWLSFARSYGNEYDEAIEKGVDEKTAAFGATITSLLNSGIEIGFDGASGIQGLPKDVLEGGTNKVLAWVTSALEEGGEEGVQKFVNEIVGKFLYQDDSEILNPIEYGKEMTLGTLSGLALGGGQITAQAVQETIGNAAQKRQESKLTENEQKVFDKVVADEIAKAKEKGEVSKKDEAKIREDVRTKLEKGYISTDTIEEVLGGDTYKSYRDTVTGEDVKSFVQGSRLAESYNEVERKKQAFTADLSKYDAKQQAHIKEAIESGVLNNSNRTHDLVDFTAKVSSDTGVPIRYSDTKKLKADGLYPKHTVDLKADGTATEYDIGIKNLDENFKPVVKVGGIEVKNYTVDFKNGKITFDSAPVGDVSVTVEGTEIVDAVYTKDGIILNVKSPKYLEALTGHELYHGIQAAKLDGNLKKALKAFAEARGEWETRLSEKQAKYKGIEGADPEGEVMADLLGQYVFEGRDFIMELATKDRNAFQKLWDGVKHMVKLATAGSQEARRLLQVEREFEKVYRELAKAQKSTADGGVEYSLNIKHTDGSVEKLADARSLTSEQATNYLRQAKAGALRGETYIPVRKDTPQVIIDTLAEVNEQVGNNSLVMQVRKAQQAMSAGKSGKQSGKKGNNVRSHGLSEAQIVEIVNKLDDPSTMIYQTNRQDKNGNPLPNNVAVFVQYNNGGNEGLAVIEFDSSFDSESIGTEFGDTNYHTVVTVFEPDVERNGVEFDYAEELLSNPNNYELEIKRRQDDESATREKHPNTSNELPSSAANIAENQGNVKKQFSVSEEVTEEQNQRGLEAKSEVQYSLSHDTEYMDKAISMNDASLHVTSDNMTAAKEMRARIAARMVDIKDRGLVGIPEDVEGNTYIANSSYDGTEENTTICPRSLASEAFTDAVSEYLGRPLTVEEQIYISQDLQGRSLTPECTYCYVATDRKAYRAFLGEYINQRDAVIEKLKANPSADVSRNGDLYKEFLNGRKDTKPMYNRFKMWVDAYTNGKPMIEASNLANISKLMGDINSEFGAELKPQIVDAMKYAQSASWAKKRVNYVAYNGHILKWKQDRINKLNSHYGLRMYSFSDFHPAFVLENMQMITDASVRGLKMLGYTKDTDFVEIFAPTGMNINVSTFGFETNGNVYENNIIGAEWEKAKALREQYPNVGITFVATNDHLVNWAMEQDWIDVVIPYHLVRTGAEVAKAFGYTNYTSESSDTKDAGWTKGKDKNYIAPTDHNNDKATYLAALEKNKLKPRFERFIDNPNYMKLVNESRQPASQSKPVQPVFNEDAAMVALAKLEANGYYQPIGGSVERMYEIAAEVAEDMTKQLAPVTQHSLSDASEQPIESGYRATLGKDVAYEAPAQEEIAPVAENATTTEETTAVEDLFPDDTAPIQQEYESLLAEREDIVGAMDAFAAVGDYASAEQLMPEYEAVQNRIAEIEADDMDRLASLDEADAPPEMDNAPEDVADNVPLTKTLVAELAKNVRSQLGLPANRVAEVRDLIQRYSNEEFPSKAHLYTEIQERFGTISETEVNEELKGVKSLLRTYGINVDDFIKSEIPDYAQLMRSNFGKVRFSKEGLPVDVAYKEFAEALPGYFPESVYVPTDQLMRIIEVANMDTTTQTEYEIDGQTIEGITDAIMNGVAAFKQNRKETLANKHGRESFQSLMENADQYAPPIPQNVAPVRPAIESVQADPDDIAPVFETSSGQQALMPEVEVPKRVTRSDLHYGIMDNIKTYFKNKGFDFDKVLKDAKDLSTFATVDNTPQRVMEKALGYKEGQMLSEMTVNRVARNETDGIRWLNSFTDKKSGLLAKISKQYGIKPGSKASAAAQMYAEGFYVGENDAIIAYGDRELAADFPDTKVRENIKKLARDPRIRQIYDETLEAINKSRTRNAYPEIPRLDNYFLHFRAMEDTFSRMGLPFNPNDIRAKDLPTDLNGVTADLKPGQPYFASAMHRTGKRTSFDLLGGLEKYLTSAKNQIYHIDDIQTFRALRNYVAETYGQANGLKDLDLLSDEEAEQRIEQVYNSHLSTFAKFLNEEANVLAGKTSLIDRGLEGVIGRRGITFLDTLNKQVGANMVGFNVSSSLTNFLAPVQAFAKTNKADFVKAMAQTASNKIASIFGKGDNFAEESPVMIRRKGAERFYRTPYQKVADTGYVLMGVVDDISTELIARTKYNEFTRKGMSSNQAHYETDKWVSRLMGDRSLGQQPQLYNSKMLGLFTKFQLEVRNQLDSQFYDTIQEAKASTEEIENKLLRNAKKAAKITSTFAQLAVMQHLFGKAFESVAGYNPAFDIIEALIKATGWDDEEEDEDAVLDNIEQGFLELLGDLPYTSTLTGGRIPIASALPVTEFIKGEDQYGNEKNRWQTLGEAAPYYLLPGGYGQIKKTKAGMEMFSDDHPIAGSYTGSGNLRFPVEDTTGNRVQAALFGQWASENARDYFNNERKPLQEKQIQELIDTELPIRDYWEYREGLSGLEGIEEKADYIAGLDLPISTKNILINNIADRKEIIDLTDYEDYSGLEEMDFAMKNPEKYEIAQAVGGYQAYMTYKEGMKDMKLAEKVDYVAGLNLTTRQKNILINGETDRKEPIDLTGYENFSNFEEFEYAKKNPESYAMAKAVGGYEAYMEYSDALDDIRSDKDKYGKSISGSRKPKVQAYIDSLNADPMTKIILYKSQYTSFDDYNYEICEYLDNRADISREEMLNILRKLDFDVDAEGNIYW